MFKVVECAVEGGFWIEGPNGRLGLQFEVEDDAEGYVMSLEEGAAAERSRIRRELLAMTDLTLRRVDIDHICPPEDP